MKSSTPPSCSQLGSVEASLTEYITWSTGSLQSHSRNIQIAGVSRGRNGIKIDKRDEKLAEFEEDLLELRTDGNDAFDSLYIGCEKFPYRDTLPSQ